MNIALEAEAGDALAELNGPDENIHLQVCLAETELRVRQLVLWAIKEAGHDVVLAKEARDLVRYQRQGIEPNVLVGSSAFMQATARAGVQGAAGPALLLARTRDTSFLPTFMRRNPANDIVVLPQSDDALRMCVADFLRRQQQHRPLRSSIRGDYLFMPQVSQVHFAGRLVVLSRSKFALAQALFLNPDMPMSKATLYKLAWGGKRREVSRLIDSNVSLLAHLLELDGRHGYLIRHHLQDAYCLASTPERVASRQPGRTPARAMTVH